MKLAFGVAIYLFFFIELARQNLTGEFKWVNLI